MYPQSCHGMGVALWVLHDDEKESALFRKCNRDLLHVIVTQRAAPHAHQGHEGESDAGDCGEPLVDLWGAGDHSLATSTGNQMASAERTAATHVA